MTSEEFVTAMRKRLSVRQVNFHLQLRQRLPADRQGKLLLSLGPIAKRILDNLWLPFLLDLRRRLP